MRITENLQQNFPFISVINYVDQEYVGIIINQDSNITSMYDYTSLKSEEEKTRFLVKAASLPASTINVIDIPFRGRNLKIAGDRTFDPWTITVINDVDFKIRTAFERWMNAINKHDDNSGLINPAQYQRDAIVKLFGRSSVQSANSSVTSPTITASGDSIPVLKAYQFYGVFPTAVSAIDLSYDTSDTIEEFTVEFQVQYWTAGETSDQTGIVLT